MRVRSIFPAALFMMVSPGLALGQGTSTPAAGTPLDAFAGNLGSIKDHLDWIAGQSDFKKLVPLCETVGIFHGYYEAVWPFLVYQKKEFPAQTSEDFYEAMEVFDVQSLEFCANDQTQTAASYQDLKDAASATSRQLGILKARLVHP